MVTKKLEEEKRLVVKFTEDEIAQLDIKKDWKYSIVAENGKIVLTPYSTVEIDIEQFDKEILIELINRSVEKDISINEVIEEILEERFTNVN